MRKPRLRNTKKPVEKNRVLTAQQIWYSEYFHTNESEFFFLLNLVRTVNYGLRHSYRIPKDFCIQCIKKKEDVGRSL